MERMDQATPLICKMYVQGLGRGYGEYCNNQVAEDNNRRLKDQRKERAPTAETGVPFVTPRQLCPENNMWVAAHARPVVMPNA